MQLKSVAKSIRSAYKEVIKDQTAAREATGAWLGDISRFSERSMEELIQANAHFKQWQDVAAKAQTIVSNTFEQPADLDGFSDQVVFDATMAVRDDVNTWLGQRRNQRAGLAQEIDTAMHNAVSRFLSKTSIVELLDDEDDIPVPTVKTIDGRVKLHLEPPKDLIMARYEKPEERILVDNVFVTFDLTEPNQWAVGTVVAAGLVVNEKNKPGRSRATTSFSGSLAEYDDDIPKELVDLVDGALRLLALTQGSQQ